MADLCQYCNKKFTRRDNLLKHLKNKRCIWLKIEPMLTQKSHTLNKKKIILKKPKVFKSLPPETQTTEDPLKFNNISRDDDRLVTKADLNRLEKQIAELKQRPNNTTNNLQIVCVGSKDNYLDMLTHEYGDFERALDYIKDCALSNLTGDCKLIAKIYLSNDDNSILYIDKGRTKIQYFNENKQQIIDSRESFGRKLANNLQNSYLKGVNYLITQNLESKRCPNKFLEDHDIQMWNQHIYQLSDHRYQKKIINNLDIPISQK